MEVGPIQQYSEAIHDSIDSIYIYFGVAGRFSQLDQHATTSNRAVLQKWNLRSLTETQVPVNIYKNYNQIYVLHLPPPQNNKQTTCPLWKV